MSVTPLSINVVLSTSSNFEARQAVESESKSNWLDHKTCPEDKVKDNVTSATKLEHVLLVCVTVCVNAVSRS